MRVDFSYTLDRSIPEEDELYTQLYTAMFGLNLLQQGILQYDIAQCDNKYTMHFYGDMSLSDMALLSGVL